MRALLLTAVFPAFLLAVDPAEVSRHIRENDLVWLRAEAKAVVSLSDSRKNTPLHWAATHGSAEAVEILLEAGADANLANSLGITPLIASATEPAKVKLLLARGANPTAKSQIGQHALAVAAGSPMAAESVKMLLAAGASPLEPGARGTPNLLQAIGSGCAEENVRLLLAAGADARAKDGSGMGALHGSNNCSIGLLRELIARGANVNVQNTMGGSVKKGPTQLVGLSPLMFAAAHRELAVVETLVKAGANIHAEDIRGMTPLLFAVSSEEQNVAVIRYLLSKGADAKHKDKNGEDALAWARKFNRPAVLALFGAKPEAVASKQVSAQKGPGAQPALVLLEKTNEQFFQETGCSSCHHGAITSMAAARAGLAGLSVNAGFKEARGMRVKGFLMGFGPALQQLVPPPGDIDTALYTLLEAKNLELPSSPELETLSRYIAARQLPNGSFTMRGISRSPMEESDIHRTALALWLLPHYSDAAAREALKPRMALALRWLATQPARNTDERGMKLLGLKWGGADAAAIAKATKELAASQLADGAFTGNPDLPGDAFSTGLAIYALRQGAGWPAANRIVQKAASWLKATQREDASWFQKSRSPKFQPYFESGFPYGHDQWISSAATAWAVIGLAESGGI